MGASYLTIYRRKLPHWRMEGSIYFVTWRLAKGQNPLKPAERSLVADALTHFDGQCYELLAYVVMDDHVHALVLPLAPHTLQQILHSWKSFTAKALRGLSKRAVPVWLDEYFDRIIRDEKDLIQKAEYILGNPVKRWPETVEYPWVGLGFGDG
ncbi:MAG: transposase [Thermodesulfobacteriota bacterium]